MLEVIVHAVIHNTDINENWPVPSAVTYIEVADRLLLMAAQAQSLEAQLQFEQLAKLYEKLAATAVEVSQIAAATEQLEAQLAPIATRHPHN